MNQPLQILAILLVLFCLLFFQVWCRSKYNETAFNITKLMKQETKLKNDQRAIEIRLGQLKSPARMEKLAKRFKLKLPASNQVDILR